MLVPRAFWLKQKSLVLGFWAFWELGWGEFAPPCFSYVQMEGEWGRINPPQRGGASGILPPYSPRLKMERRTSSTKHDTVMLFVTLQPGLVVRGHLKANWMHGISGGLTGVSHHDGAIAPWFTPLPQHPWTCVCSVCAQMMWNKVSGVTSVNSITSAATLPSASPCFATRVWPCVSYLTSICLCFLTCKMGT